MGGRGGRRGRCQTCSFVLFSLFSRPRAGLATPCKVFFRTGNQYAECERQQQNYLYERQQPTHDILSEGDIIYGFCKSTVHELKKNLVIFQKRSTNISSN